MVIVGVNGRIGQELKALAPEMGFSALQGVLKGGPSLERIDPAKCDVVVDFSLPEATEETARWCGQNLRPLVSGVTGLSSAQMQALQAAAQKTAVFHSANMSLGVAVLAKMLASLAALKGFDFQIEEIHHREKKDQPSGTALLLQRALQSNLTATVPAPLSIRGGGVFGVHRILALGGEEILTLEHTAMNRRVFARGALKAASWVLSQPPGFYGMPDLIASTAAIASAN